MTRPLWLPLFAIGSALILCAWLSAARAAVHIDNPALTIRPEKAADTDTPICLDATTRTRLWLHKDGSKEVVSRFTVYQACQ